MIDKSVTRPCSELAPLTSPAGRRVWQNCRLQAGHPGPHSFSTTCTNCGQDVVGDMLKELPAQESPQRCEEQAVGLYRGTVKQGGAWTTLKYRGQCILPKGHKGEHITESTT